MAPAQARTRPTWVRRGEDAARLAPPSTHETRMRGRPPGHRLLMTHRLSPVLLLTLAACGASGAPPAGSPTPDAGDDAATASDATLSDGGALDGTPSDATPPDGTLADVASAGLDAQADSHAESDAPSGLPPGHSVLTQHNDNARSGSNLNETVLTTANVNPASFGRIFTRAVDDQVYAQPLVVAGVSMPGKGVVNVLYVVTMSDSIYAFDADDASASAPYWKASLVDPAHGIVPVTHGDVGQACGTYLDIGGNIGIESTPVVDSAAQTLYVVAKTKENGSQVFRLHALDLATGAERGPSPVVLDASVPGNGAGSDGGVVSFDPSLENQRPALLLASGKLYIAFSSYCDSGNYHGWVLAYDAASLTRVAAMNVTPDGALGGIWMSGQGPCADDSGNVYVKVGNGDTDVQSGGTSYGEALLRLTPDLTPSDWFVPYDYADLNATDLEVGSSGVLLLPQSHLLISGSKKSKIYVNDTNGLGSFHAADDSQIVQSVSLDAGELHGSPVTWTGASGTFVYVWAADDVVRSYTLAGGRLAAGAVGTSPKPGWPGGSLAVSANGTTAGTGIVWAAMPLTGANEGLIPGVLRALDATNVGSELWSSRVNAARDDCGFYAKYASPTVVNGKVYLPTFSNQVCVYGLLAGGDAGAPFDAAACYLGPNPSYAASCTDCNIGDTCVLTCAGCTRIDGTESLNASVQLPCATGA